MNSQIQGTVRKLMELHTLEDRLKFFTDHSESTVAVKSQISALRTQVPANILARHDRLRARKKRSVAEARNGVCSGCHMSLGISQRPMLLHEEALQTCQHCGRFLYLSKATVAQPEAEAATEKPKKSPKKKKREEEHSVVLL